MRVCLKSCQSSLRDCLGVEINTQTTPATGSIEDTESPLHIDPRSDFTFFQLNCHNRYDSTMSTLNSELTHVALLLQEPWVNPHNWLPPMHQNWHKITPNASLRTKDKKPQACTYINRQIPSHQIDGCPQDNALLMVTTLLDMSTSIPQLTLLSSYNPPMTFAGIQILNQWL
ncbi:hypothetical protein O181_041484 [Austropuccinia psidii MF-1]|uniref:Uncharacterized protein n=1 Tax=Austropuccinia psidii MF-1 TaxID=1389203 RepID=A0A9Q3DE97_9BASI|nr:hypothetical protein [Austropuccinia psidii MF-1]